MISGDHVLPTITPHISGLGTTVDPLKDFFDSLDLMKTFDGVRTVLPAHGLEFGDLSGRAEDIKRHHHERLEKLRTAQRRARPRHRARVHARCCSRNGRGARWPRARPTPTSNTSASSAKPQVDETGEQLRYSFN